MALENLTHEEMKKIQCISRAGNNILRLQKLDKRIISETSVVLAALANCEKRLRDLYPRINSHFMEVKELCKKKK